MERHTEARSGRLPRDQAVAARALFINLRAVFYGIRRRRSLSSAIRGRRRRSVGIIAEWNLTYASPRERRVAK
jgi:hypothetical protein